MRLYILIFTLLVGFLAPQAAQAQEMEGSIRFLVTHNWSKKMAAVEYLSKQKKEKIAYVWGSRSEWKVFTQMYFTPTATYYVDSDERAEVEDEGYSWRREAFGVKRDFSTNTRYDILTLAGKAYVIQDTIEPPNWKVLNDLKEVAGHLCMSASWSDTIKSQRIIAWFALDMPSSGGPELYCGLPGMILEVNINDGAMVITADKIEIKKLTTEMNLPKKIKGKKVNTATYQTEVRKFLEEKRKNEEPPFWGMRY